MFQLTKENNYYNIEITGKLCHRDYVETIIPQLEEILTSTNNKEHRFLLDIAEFQGWSEIRAAYDDFKLGIKYHNNFGTVAIIGDTKWEKFLCKTFAFLMKGEVKFFYPQDKQQAIEWLENK